MDTVVDRTSGGSVGKPPNQSVPRAPLEPGRGKPLPQGVEKAARIAQQQVRLFIAASKRGLPLGYLDAFLAVALREGRAVEEYAEILSMSKSSISRVLLDIGDATRTHTPGLGWVTSRANPVNLRRREVWLTPKGRALLNRLEDLDRLKR